MSPSVTCPPSGSDIEYAGQYSMPAVNSTARGTFYPLWPPAVLSRVFASQKSDESWATIHNPPDSRWALDGSSSCTDIRIKALTSIRDDSLQITSSLWPAYTLVPLTALEKLGEYFVQSHSTPLDIRVELTAHSLPHPQTFNSMLQILISVVFQFHRWRKLVVSLVRESMVHHVAIVEAELLCSCPTRLLCFFTAEVGAAEVRISVAPSDIPRRPTIVVHDPFDTAGSFHRFRGLAVQLWRPPLQHLSALHLDKRSAIPIAYPELKILLVHFMNLTYLSLYGDRFVGRDWAPASSPGIIPPPLLIPLPTLCSVRIRSSLEFAFSGILKHIDAPRLRSLILKGMWSNEAGNVRLQPPFGVSLPQLRELTMCDFELSEEAYRVLFCVAPGVKVFNSLSSTGGTFVARAALCENERILGGGKTDCGSGHGGAPWAGLHSLGLRFDEREDPLSIGWFLGARKAMGSPLTEIRFDGLEHLDQTVIGEWLRDADVEREYGAKVGPDGSGIGKWPQNLGRFCCWQCEDVFF